VYYEPPATASLADILFPIEDFWARVVRDAILIFCFTLFVILLARFSIHLPFTPVPVTGQTFAMLVTGAALGSWRGGATMTVYLLIGMLLPVYAGASDGYLWDATLGDYVFGFSSGSSGFFWQMASGGYLIGFIVGAWLVGFLCERGLGASIWILPVLLAANALVYVPGLIQFSLFAPEGGTMAQGLYPFIPGDLIKLFLAALLIPAVWGIANGFSGDGEDAYDSGRGGGRRDRWL